MKVFILSPARTTGKRAKFLLNEEATFPLARKLHNQQAVPLGEIFTFLSGLYFRGKLAYAEKFGQNDLIYIITSNLGLLSPNHPMGVEALRHFSSAEISLDDPEYLTPLQSSLTVLRESIPKTVPVILLGSVATDKYVTPLRSVFSERLYFPVDFIGRGDMSRGGLMLRSASSGVELEYQLIADDTKRSGSRPAKLIPS